MPTDSALRSPLTLEDLTADLLWPRLLRSPALGLNPGRMVLAFLGIVVVAVVLQCGLWVDRGIKGTPTPERLTDLRAYVANTDLLFTAPQLHRATVLWRWMCSLPLRAVTLFPVTTLLAFPIALITWLTILTAISRSAACEVAQGVSLSWPHSLGFAVSRWKSVVAAFLLPLLAIYLILVGIAVASAVLFRFPVLNLLGALLFGLMLMGGLAAAVIAFGYMLGRVLFIPSITCDGADAFDAVQRAYAYVVGRPLRLVVYILISAAAVWLAVFVALAIAFTAGGLTLQAASAWSGETGRATLAAVALPVFEHRPLDPESAAGAKVTGSFATTAAALRFWFSLLLVLVASYAVSAIGCAMTQVYLLLRRANDGQDISEIWMPGMVNGTLAPAAPNA